MLQAKKAAPEIPANNVITPAKVVMETQSINITVTSNVNIQVAGSTSQKSTQTARIEQVLDGFRAKPFVDGKHMTYTSKEFEVPENPSRNNTQKDPKTDPIIISDD